ncbi:unnamed protein product, partial [Prorocentrum cordatum]
RTPKLRRGRDCRRHTQPEVEECPWRTPQASEGRPAALPHPPGRAPPDARAGCGEPAVVRAARGPGAPRRPGGGLHLRRLRLLQVRAGARLHMRSLPPAAAHDLRQRQRERDVPHGVPGGVSRGAGHLRLPRRLRRVRADVLARRTAAGPGGLLRAGSGVGLLRAAPGALRGASGRPVAAASAPDRGGTAAAAHVPGAAREASGTVRAGVRHLPGGLPAPRHAADPALPRRSAGAQLPLRLRGPVAPPPCRLPHLRRGLRRAAAPPGPGRHPARSAVSDRPAPRTGCCSVQPAALVCAERAAPPRPPRGGPAGGARASLPPARQGL